MLHKEATDPWGEDEVSLKTICLLCARFKSIQTQSIFRQPLEQLPDGSPGGSQAE